MIGRRTIKVTRRRPSDFDFREHTIFVLPEVTLILLVTSIYVFARPG